MDQNGLYTLFSQFFAHQNDELPFLFFMKKLFWCPWFQMAQPSHRLLRTYIPNLPAGSSPFSSFCKCSETYFTTSGIYPQPSLYYTSIDNLQGEWFVHATSRPHGDKNTIRLCHTSVSQVCGPEVNLKLGSFSPWAFFIQHAFLYQQLLWSISDTSSDPSLNK